jgi:hypothetical protein
MIIQWMDKWGFEEKKTHICNQKKEVACNVFVFFAIAIRTLGLFNIFLSTNVY